MKKIKIKNMGFTLIELLVTIVIMISILSLAIISYNNISKAKKEDAYTSVKNQVESAAREYFYANEYIFEDIKNGDSGSSKTILLKDLVDGGYMTSVTDPRTGKKLHKCTQVTVKKIDGKYTFSLNETVSCDESKEVTLSVVEQKRIVNVTFIKGENVFAIGESSNTTTLTSTCTIQPNNTTCTIDDNDIPSITPVSGYTSDGWNTAQDGTGAKFDSKTSVENDITVYTKIVRTVFTPKKYTVTFHKGDNVKKIGNSTNDTKIVECDTTEENPNSCSVPYLSIEPNDNYKARGWNTAQDGTGTWYLEKDKDKDITISTNLHLYSVVFKNKFTAHFDFGTVGIRSSGMGSSLCETIDRCSCKINNYGESCEIRAAKFTTTDEYNFLGWNNNKDNIYYESQGKITLNSSNDETTYYAKVIKKSTITYGEVCARPGNDSWCRGNITYTVTASDDDEYITDIRYKINGNYIEPKSDKSDFSVSKSNSNRTLVLEYKAETVGTNIEFYGVTNNGNTQSIVEVAKIDKTPPNIESTAIKCEGVNVINTKFAQSVNDKWTNKSVCYTLTPTDNLSGIDISHNYSGIGTGTFKESINTTGNYSTITSPTDPVIKDTNAVFKIEGDGKRRANYVVYDKAGNIGELNLYTNIDTIKPNCDFKVTTNKARPGNVVTPKSFESVGYDYDVNWYIPTDNSNNPSIKIEPDGSDGQSGFANYTYFMQDTDFINPMSYVINDNTTEYGLDFSLQVVDKAGNTKTCNKVFGLEKEVTLSLDVDKMKETKSYNPVMYTASMSKYGTNYSSNGNLVFNNANNPNVCSYTCDDDNKCAVKCKENPGCRDENGISCDSANYGYYFARTCQRVSNFLNYFTVDSASLGGTKIRKTFTVTNYKNDNINNDCYSHINYENSGYYTDDICKNAISETEYEKKSEFGNGLESAPENDYFIMTKKHNGTNLFDRDKNDFVNFKSLNNNASGISMVPLIRFSDLNVYNKTYSKAYQNYNYKKITDSTGGENFNAVKYEYVSPAGNISNAITLFTEFVAKCGYADSKLKDINGNTYMRSSYCANEYEDIKYWVKSKIGTTITDKSIGYDNSNFLIYSTHESTNNSSTYIINRKDCILKRVSTSTCYDLHVGSTESWTCTDNNWR